MSLEDPANPDPATTPGLEPGGGVQPGDTPPIEASTTGSSDRQPGGGERAISRVAIALILGGAVLVGLLGLVWAVVRASSL